MPALFKDLSKKASDTLNKGFDSKNSVKVTTKSANGVTYNAQINSAGEGKIAGKVGAKFKHGKSGLNVKKLEVANNGSVTAQVNLEDKVDNATFSVDVACNPLSEQCLSKAVLGLDYTHDKARVTVGVSPLQPTAANLSILIKAHDNVLIGGSYAGKLDDTWKHTGDNVGIGYTTADNVVTLTTAKFFEQFTLAGFHQHNSDIALAATVGLSRSNPASANITVGGSLKVDADTAIKAKVNVPSGTTAGSSLSLGLNQKINSSVRLTAGSKISLDPQADLFGASFALGLELGSV